MSTLERILSVFWLSIFCSDLVAVVVVDLTLVAEDMAAAADDWVWCDANFLP